VAVGTTVSVGAGTVAVLDGTAVGAGAGAGAHADKVQINRSVTTPKADLRD
jgi:hypothetical protein